MMRGHNEHQYVVGKMRKRKHVTFGKKKPSDNSFSDVYV